jgi:4-diphosphocytidyl-2-C-methyl-D-erythritol kinase
LRVFLWIFALMIVFPNAKINLGLSVLNKRKDGYHNLESIFLPVPFFDSLEFIESNKLSFESSIEIDDEKSNSILQAYQFIKEIKDIPPVSIYVHKNIPIGAGLGGGSADGAFMLNGLNDYFNLDLSVEQLEKLALKIGSDCPFFIQNKPKLVHGTGDILSDITISLSGYYIAVINPKIHVSTKMAFSNLKLKKNRNSDLKNVVNSTPISEWKNSIFNDFEPSIFKQYPSIESLKNQCYKLGAIYSSMSGTGSTVYGVFEKEIDLSSFNSDYFVQGFQL